MSTKLWSQSQLTMLVSSAGSSRIELAKMIGMTPAWLTFSGM